MLASFDMLEKQKTDQKEFLQEHERVLDTLKSSLKIDEVKSTIFVDRKEKNITSHRQNLVQFQEKINNTVNNSLTYLCKEARLDL
jgi:hypothetical protein